MRRFSNVAIGPVVLMLALTFAMQRAGYAQVADTRKIGFVCHMTNDATAKVVKKELARFISALRPTQSFDVIVVTEKGDAAGYAKDGVPVAATDDNKRLVLQFLETVKPTRSDNPIAAMKLALGRKYTLLYFLTDAPTLHKDFTEPKITALNVNKIRISTLLFETFTKPTEAMLISIAEKNAGHFRYIRASDSN
ncbi:hypothetical protein [Humisphaera borealis]|uniref:Uncharacterized protein n=1 Tax=Humisphaera borealis TaxID=2807512 RepID=A0A7M2WZE4_9BACT|nr:hypothetical protein [Humisphaera borealis]QOV90856.1 hypothetical protein IPV69_05715 [Humisphaera borealis]